MANTKLTDIPKKVIVKRLVSSRYQKAPEVAEAKPGEKPSSWDARREGFDLIEDNDGQLIELWSDGGQSPPTAGWVLMITSEFNDSAYRWTLYGIQSDSAQQKDFIQ